MTRATFLRCSVIVHYQSVYNIYTTYILLTEFRSLMYKTYFVKFLLPKGGASTSTVPLLVSAPARMQVCAITIENRNNYDRFYYYFTTNMIPLRVMQ